MKIKRYFLALRLVHYLGVMDTSKLVFSLLLFSIAFFSKAQNPESDTTSCINDYTWSGRLEKPTHPALHEPMCMLWFSTEKAYELFDKKIAFFQKNEDWVHYVWTNNWMALVILSGRADDNFLAKPYLDNALKAAEKYLPDDHPGRASTYYLWGEWHRYTQEAIKALDYLNVALEKRILIYGEQHRSLMNVYYVMGDVHLNLRLDYRTAEKFYSKSIQISEITGTNFQEIVETNIQLAKTNYLKGDFDRAMSHANEALQTIVEYETIYNKEWIPRVNAEIATIYAAKLEYEKSIHYYMLSINAAISLQLDPLLLAQQYIDLGRVYTDFGNYEKAINSINKAEPILDETNRAKQIRISIHSQLGSTYLSAGRLNESLLQTQQALSLSIKLNGQHHRITSGIYNNLGLIYLQEKAFEEGLTAFQMSMISGAGSFNQIDVDTNPTPEQLGSQHHLFDRPANKGALYIEKFHVTSDMTDLESAVVNLGIAVEWMQLYMSAQQREGSKLLLMDKYRMYYASLIESLFELYTISDNTTYLDKAFQFMEKSKSQLLVQAMNDLDISSQTNVPDSILNKKRTFEIDMAFYQNRIEEERQKPEPSEKIIQELNTSYLALDREFDSLTVFMKNKYPNFMEASNEGNVPGLVDAQSFAKSTQSQVIEYFWSDKYLYCISISPSKSSFLKVDIDSTLHSSLESYSQELKSKISFSNWETRFEDFSNSAFQIYNRIFAPVDDSDVSRIFIIPDGPLRMIPFQALVTEESNSESRFNNLPYLLNKYSIGYSNTFQLLERSFYNTPDVADPSLLAFSYSGNVNNPGLKVQLGTLPFTELEIENIQKYLGVDLYKDSEASEANFKSNAAKYDIIHLAIHGISDPDQSYGSLLVFDGDEKTSEDGILHAFELYDLNLKASLVVLSACESGIGKQFEGEGLYSMARGFLYANCPSVLMTLWSIKDKSTADLMDGFYERLEAGLDANEALREAQLRFIAERDNLSAHPSNWAGFILLGHNPKFKSGFSSYWIIGIAIALIAFVVIRKKRSVQSV